MASSPSRSARVRATLRTRWKPRAERRIASAASRTRASPSRSGRGDLLEHLRRAGGVGRDPGEPEIGDSASPAAARAAATRAATSAEPSAGGGRIRSAAVTAGTSMTRSMRSSSGPEMRAWYLRHAALVRLPAAGEARLGRLAAAARVHGGDELEARRIGDAVVGAGDHDLAGLERLAQRIERLRLELGQLVEEQHAVMGERDLARPGVEAAADQRRHRGRVVRRAERPAVRRARRSRAGRRPTGSSTLRAARAAPAAAGSRAAAAPASTCRRPAGRSSGGCGRRRRRSRARAWRSPGP